MGVAIHYRGSLDNLDCLVDFEDRVIDLALELGGQAKIWRSADDDNPRRMVRGVLVNLCPGQETASLLISPEGWLIGLCDIEEAEQGTLAEPPFCFMKTQFGTVEGHVALVEMLTALKREFLTDLEVSDEGEYWETRNAAGLIAKFKQIQAALDGVAAGLERHGLASEAAEDQEILIKRIERIAGVVHRTLARPAEHPPVFGAEEGGFDDDPDESEARWDASFKENRRRQERVHRAIEEHLAEGKDVEEAFEAAMLEETSFGLPEEEKSAEFSQFLEEIAREAEEEANEPWKESLPEAGDPFEDMEFHPLQKRAHELLSRLYGLPALETEVQSGHIDALLQGAGDVLGGLAQALGFEEAPSVSGLTIVQLKRALRGAAYALGALYPLQAEGILDKAVVETLRAALDELQTDIFEELSRQRQRLEEGF